MARDRVMSEMALYILIFGGLFLLRFALVTFVFFCLMPADDRCPQCDDHTLWVRAPIRNRIMPWLRTSWCPTCGWEGVVRHPPRPARKRHAPSPVQVEH